MAIIRLDECPPTVVNYYDRGPSAYRVKRVSSNLLRSGDVQYTVTHTYGKDRWQYIDHEWRRVSEDQSR